MQTALWTLISYQSVLWLLSYNRLSIKPILFKSFTGITVQEFDNVYNKEIAKRYEKQRYNAYHAKEKKIEKESLVLLQGILN